MNFNTHCCIVLNCKGTPVWLISELLKNTDVIEWMICTEGLLDECTLFLKYAKCEHCLNFKNVTSPCCALINDRERNVRPGTVWRWLCPLLWELLWFSPSLFQHWLSCHRPPTQSPGLAHLVPERPTPAAMVNSTAAGSEPRNVTKSKVALLSN